MTARRMSLLTRGLVLGLAAAACAWFVIGIRQDHAVDQATTLAARGSALTQAGDRHALQLLSSAKFLNPDRQVDVLRAQIFQARGNLVLARRTLKPVVASEPDNLAAWIALARASLGDPKDFYAAAYRIRQLVPPVPPPP